MGLHIDLKKNCCLVIAVILLVAGICFQSFETYSYFERNSQNLQSGFQSVGEAVAVNDVRANADVKRQQPGLDGIHNYGISAGVIAQEML